MYLLQLSDDVGQAVFMMLLQMPSFEVSTSPVVVVVLQAHPSASAMRAQTRSVCRTR
jgi:hypothetical protein